MSKYEGPKTDKGVSHRAYVERKYQREKYKEISESEMRVLLILCEGKINKEIAEIVHLSEKTIKNHIGRLFSKTNTQNRQELLVWAINNKVYIPEVYRDHSENTTVNIKKM